MSDFRENLDIKQAKKRKDRWMIKFTILAIVLIIGATFSEALSNRGRYNYGLWNSGFKLKDPDADRLVIWDDSEGVLAFATTIPAPALVTDLITGTTNAQTIDLRVNNSIEWSDNSETFGILFETNKIVLSEGSTGVDTLDVNDILLAGDNWNDQRSYQMAADIHHLLADPLVILAWTTPATTEQDLTAENHDATYQNMETTDQDFMVQVWGLTLGGTDEYLTIADHADLSFLNGAADADVSMGGWVNIYDDANIKTIMAKYDDTNSQLEWELFIDTAEKVNWRFYDESAGATAYEGRITDAAVSVGWNLIIVTYDKDQTGESASDGMEISVNGSDVASSASDGAGVYAAKENLTQAVWIGAQGEADTYGNGWVGTFGALFIDQSTLTDSLEWELSLTTRGYYGQ